MLLHYDNLLSVPSNIPQSCNSGTVIFCRVDTLPFDPQEDKNTQNTQLFRKYFKSSLGRNRHPQIRLWWAEQVKRLRPHRAHVIFTLGSLWDDDGRRIRESVGSLETPSSSRDPRSKNSSRSLVIIPFQRQDDIQVKGCMSISAQLRPPTLLPATTTLLWLLPWEKSLIWLVRAQDIHWAIYPWAASLCLGVRSPLVYQASTWQLKGRLSHDLSQFHFLHLQLGGWAICFFNL